MDLIHPSILLCVLVISGRTVAGADPVETSAGSSVFADLSVGEMNSVIRYLKQHTSLNLANSYEAGLKDASIHLIEAIRPVKSAALRYLNGSGPAPERAAKAIIIRGDMVPPQIEEYRVFPVPNPTGLQLIKNPKWKYPIPFNAGSSSSLQQLLPLYNTLNSHVAKINDILLDITGGYGHGGGCGKKCLKLSTGLPANVESQTLKVIAQLVRDIEGPELHPIGVEFTLNLEHSADPAKWFVELVWLQGQYFTNFEEVRTAYEKGILNLTRVQDPPGLFSVNLTSSLNFRGEPRPSEPKRGPQSSMPDGPRYSVSERLVKWNGWEFEFAMLSTTGTQLYNVKFLNERIAWELALQELGVFYSGGSPLPRHTSYYDSYITLGLRVSELIPGIDCPHHAKYFDFVHFWYFRPQIYKNGACIFEHDRGIPLRRHIKYDSQARFEYAQGMPDNVLVFRQIITVSNYDYIIDFMFHQAGQIEGKVSLSGYVLDTFYTGPEMNKYGNVLNEPTSIGNIHHHIVSIKADLDIKGVSNRFETLDIKLENITDHVNPGHTLLNRYYDRSLKRTELEAAYQFNFSTPKYLIMYNENEKNRFGNSRGYRILSDGMSKVLLPREYRGFRARAWAEYQVAVTKYSEDERASSSIYAGTEPYDPVMSFQDFIDDNENIVDEDLVAWISLGTQHIPHAEDVPIVTTPGVQLTFFLLPYNYFDEDPSLASRDNIRVTRHNSGKMYHYSGVPPYGSKGGDEAKEDMEDKDDDMNENNDEINDDDNKDDDMNDEKDESMEVTTEGDHQNDDNQDNAMNMKTTSSPTTSKASDTICFSTKYYFSLVAVLIFTLFRGNSE